MSQKRNTNQVEVNMVSEVCINLIQLDLSIPTQSAHHNGYILFVVGMVIIENASRPVQQISRDNIKRIKETQ